MIECKLGAAKNVKNRSGVLHSNASEQEKKAAEQCFQEVTGRVKTKRLEPHADASKDLSSLFELQSRLRAKASKPRDRHVSETNLAQQKTYVPRKL